MSHVIEYTVALGALLFVLAMFFNSVKYDFALREDRDEATDYRAVKILENLVGSTGWAGNRTHGTPDWHRLDPQQQDATMTGVGLAAGEVVKNGTTFEMGYGVCLWEKIIAIGNISYGDFKSLCAVETYYQFNMSFTPIETEFTPVPGDIHEVNFGYSMDGAYERSVRERIVTALRFNTTSGNFDSFAVKIHLVVFKGGYSNECLIINEILYFGEVANGREVEWVELYNPGPMAVDLSDWMIASEGSYDSFRDDASYGMMIPVGGYGIVTCDISGFLTLYPDFIPGAVPLVEVNDGFIGRNGLHNEDGDVALHYGYVQYDAVDFDTAHGGNGNGHSLEKVIIHGTDFLMHWKESVLQGGTPGARNSVADL